jgi:general secretion pathway protein C
MKRWPLLTSFVLFIALCASAAYWTLQLYKPPARPVAAPPPAASAPPDLRAAAALFGRTGRQAAVASNYKLLGVIASGSHGESVAILSADGKPAQAVQANREISPGVSVKEVHPRYVLLQEGGVEKRVELPEDALTPSQTGAPPPRATPPMPGQQAMPMRAPTPTPGMPGPQGAPTQAMPAPQQIIVPPQPQPQVQPQPQAAEGNAPPQGGVPATNQPTMPSFGSAMGGMGGTGR